MSSKPTPKAVEGLLESLDPRRAATSPNVHPCEGAEFHSPRPLATHGYRLQNGQSFWLCGTCKDNVNIYVFLWEKLGNLEWNIQRCFGNGVRSVATLVIASRKSES